jgi:hypothetical protein
MKNIIAAKQKTRENGKMVGIARALTDHGFLYLPV